MVDPTILVTANGERLAGRGRLRGADQNRTLMRHARLASTLSMGLLALAMVLPAHLRGLVSAARCPQLLLPHSLPTGLAAIALAAVTTSTDSKKSVASGIKAPAHSKTFCASIGFHCFRQVDSSAPVDEFDLLKPCASRASQLRARRDDRQDLCVREMPT